MNTFTNKEEAEEWCGELANKAPCLSSMTKEECKEFLVQSSKRKNVMKAWEIEGRVELDREIKEVRLLLDEITTEEAAIFRDATDGRR